MRVEKSTWATPQMGGRFCGHETAPMQHCHLRADGNAADTRSSTGFPMSLTPARPGNAGLILLAD
jgi:hypothetical protein